MSRSVIDHGHVQRNGARAKRYSRLERITAGEAGHPAVRLLAQRRRWAGSGVTRVRQFLRILRGRQA